jgi:antirestriction protein
MSGESGQSPEPRESEAKDRPRIYVASLSDYNAGQLHGTWLDAAQDAEALHDEVRQMLAVSREPFAEEWAIHDYEGFGPVRLSEYESLEAVSRVARGIAEHGRPFGAWAALQASLDEDDLADFELHYRGTWSSVEAYAEELLDDSGTEAALAAIPAWLQPYVHIDVEAFARDLELCGDILTYEDDTEVHIFGPH